MNATSSKSDHTSGLDVRRALPRLVAAQLTGAVGGLILALDQLLSAAPRRHKIVERDLTRC